MSSVEELVHSLDNLDEQIRDLEGIIIDLNVRATTFYKHSGFIIGAKYIALDGVSTREFREYVEKKLTRVTIERNALKRKLNAISKKANL